MGELWPITKITLRSARLLRNLSLNEVSMHVKISARKISYYERNVCATPLDVAITLLDFYGVPFYALDY
ncbi:helix-turn-helix domain-containing protein [Cohnella sp. AR92]|uniref:helix-turn-helix domain-containing protein n=1 Tax=Cohnella sp. AR92 TaxID=648716 RepID=UPI00351A050B